MDATRFKAWQIVRLRGWPPHWHGSAWRIAAHIYRDRAINLCEALAGYQADLHTWEEAYSELEQERDALKAELADMRQEG
jgi:hypothetical protein